MITNTVIFPLPERRSPPNTNTVLCTAEMKEVVEDEEERCVNPKFTLQSWTDFVTAWDS